MATDCCRCDKRVVHLVCLLPRWCPLRSRANSTGRSRQGRVLGRTCQTPSWRPSMKPHTPSSLRTDTWTTRLHQSYRCAHINCLMHRSGLFLLDLCVAKSCFTQYSQQACSSLLLFPQADPHMLCVCVCVFPSCPRKCISRSRVVFPVRSLVSTHIRCASSTRS